MIYFNNAATSFPKPQCVIDAVNNCVSNLQVDLKRTSIGENKKDITVSCREAIAKLLNVNNSNCISFTSGSTHSINMVTRGLDLADSHVITTSTEHSSVIRSLKVEERDRNVKLSVVDCDKDGFIDVDHIREQINSKTKAIFINHSSNVVGTVADLYAISELAHDENILLIVDISQSAGVIPIDVKALDVDIVTFTGHKSLFGVSGIGGLYVKENVIMKPLIVGGTGIKSTSLYQTEERPFYFEAGTQNMVGITSLEAGVSYVLDHGIDTLNSIKSKLYYRLREELSKIPEVILYGKEDYYTPLVSFNIKGVDPKEVGHYLASNHEIIVRAGILCAPLIHNNIGTAPNGLVRASLSSFSTNDEVTEFVEAIKEIVNISKINKKELVLENVNLSCL